MVRRPALKPPACCPASARDADILGPSHEVALGRGEFPVRRHDELTFHREMNRLFEEVFRGAFYDPAATPLGMERREADLEGSWPHKGSWPHIEMAKTGKEIKVTAELPGLDEKDVRVELSNHVLTIDGEKKRETEEHNRWFSERYYGHFERRIPLDWDIDEDKVDASFRNGVLTITLPKSARAQEQTRRIPLHNGG
jgi:HSP20 family protein